MAHGSGLFHAEWLGGEYRPRIHAYYFKQWSNYDMQYHTHDSTEIMYVMSGSCRVALLSETGKVDAFSLRKGDFIVLNANVPHRLMVEGACRMLNVEFELAPCGGVVPSLRKLAAEDPMLADLIRTPAAYLTLSDPDEVYHALKSLVLELDKQGSDEGALAQLLLAQVLLRIARLQTEDRDRGLPQTDWYVKQAVMYMQQNYDRDIRIKDIASAVNLHPSYLQRIFKTQLGQTMTDYLTNHRMERAKMLLQRTDIPIADISEYVGVASRQYFHALFKKHSQQTPVAYRASMDKHKWRSD